jgi:hypothetical protein
MLKWGIRSSYSNKRFIALKNNVWVLNGLKDSSFGKLEWKHMIKWKDRWLIEWNEIEKGKRVSEIGN